MPKVSVILSVFNGERYLATALDSILSQTFHDLELIVNDDASTDGSSRILQDYAERDQRVVLVANGTNLGLTRSLNKMIGITKGEFIARMDADDISHPRRLEKQVAVLNQGPEIDVVFTDALLMDEHGQAVCARWRPQTIRQIVELMPIHCYIPHPSTMIRRSVFSRWGLYDERFRIGQDWDLWMRLIRRGARFHCIPEPLIRYRLNPDSVRATQGRRPRHSADFELAVTCINNSQKKLALRYWTKLCASERALLALRILLPQSFRRLWDGLRRRYSPSSELRSLSAQVRLNPIAHNEAAPAYDRRHPKLYRGKCAVMRLLLLLRRAP